MGLSRIFLTRVSSSGFKIVCFLIDLKGCLVLMKMGNMKKEKKREESNSLK